ncbi:hypothetical protein [Nocardioides sp. NPDC004968]|uniref:hypothetical protein n=1 Tax=Nocardioides sp. NPDC004968 TaxID=3155894 RepID=UPI0033A48F48
MTSWHWEEMESSALDGSVTLGGLVYPRRVIGAAQTSDRGGPQVRVVFEMRDDGTPVAVEARFTSDPDGRGLRTADLAAFRVENAAKRAFQGFAVPVSGGPLMSRTPDERRQISRDLDRAVSKRRPPTDAHLREIAEVYRTALDEGRRPTQAVADTFDLSARTAARRVEQARAAGILPKTSKGKAKG